jgi:hypothetical protein
MGTVQAFRVATKINMFACGEGHHYCLFGKPDSDVRKIITVIKYLFIHLVSDFIG